MAKNIRVDLPGSEHRGMDAVRIKLTKSDFDDGDRLADLKFTSDGMDIKLRMMESDLRILAHAILDNTTPRLDLDFE